MINVQTITSQAFQVWSTHRQLIHQQPVKERFRFRVLIKFLNVQFLQTQGALRLVRIQRFQHRNNLLVVTVVTAVVVSIYVSSCTDTLRVWKTRMRKPIDPVKSSGSVRLLRLGILTWVATETAHQNCRRVLPPTECARTSRRTNHMGGYRERTDSSLGACPVEGYHLIDHAMESCLYQHYDRQSKGH